MAVREGRDQAKVSAILHGVSLAALDRAAFRSAGFLPMPNLRTLDALHLEAAMRLVATPSSRTIIGSARRRRLLDST